MRRARRKVSVTEPSLSFSGCGFMGLYHIGVASCIKENAPFLTKGKIAGVSAGGLIAATLICDLCMGDCTQWALNMVRKARRRSLGPFHPGFDLTRNLRKELDFILPQDAHLLCSGRLYLSLTRLSDYTNILVNEYESREELINALICTCWIPFFSGFIPPVFCGVRYVDGGITNNLISLNKKTITVSPFAGIADICPTDEYVPYNRFKFADQTMNISAENVVRFFNIFFPPNTRSVLEDFCQRGYKDALKFLKTNKLISCSKHLQSTSSLFMLSKYTSQKSSRNSKHSKRINTNTIIEKKEPIFEFCPECLKAKLGNTDDEASHLPPQVTMALQNFVVHDTLYKYVCSFKAVKFLGAVTLPIRLPLEAGFHSGRKLVGWMPNVSSDFQWLFSFAKSIVKNILQKSGKSFYFARFECEFSFVNEEKVDITSNRASFCSLHSNTLSPKDSFSDLSVYSYDEKQKNFKIDFALSLNDSKQQIKKSEDDVFQSEDDELIYFNPGPRNSIILSSDEDCQMHFRQIGLY